MPCDDRSGELSPQQRRLAEDKLASWGDVDGQLAMDTDAHPDTASREESR